MIHRYHLVGPDNRTFFAEPGLAGEFTEAANDALDFTVDFSKVLADGDTIATSGTAVTVPGGLTGGSATHTNTQVAAKLSAGTAGTPYTVTFVATTTLGFVHKYLIVLKVTNSPTVKYYTKRVAEIIRVIFDFNKWLAAGDTIASKTATVAAGLTKVAATNTTNLVTVDLSAGTDGQSYNVTINITTTNGFTVEKIYNVAVSGA